MFIIFLRLQVYEAIAAFLWQSASYVLATFPWTDFLSYPFDFSSFKTG